MPLDTPVRQRQAKRILSSPDSELVTDHKRASYAEVVMSPPKTSTEASSGSSTSSIPTIVLSDESMAQISSLLVSTFKTQIESMVEQIANSVFSKLTCKLESLEKANEDLAKENADLKSKLCSLETTTDHLEQYSRRNSIRISGIKELPSENTDEIVLQIVKAVGSDIVLGDIDRSHRVGKPNPRKPRDVIVKFATYRARQKVYRSRALLKDKGYPNTFINEDLTRRRSSMLFKARQLVKNGTFIGAWSSDGNILVRDADSKIHRIDSERDLESRY